ncbi:M15 family metallopeptidase [Nocardioides nanhaiensis]|uniref:Peptidase M15C domain-containing protein n=1 Tax=Nocardioides nanhaiensis TaxID=1476871 RepID=A0ABP8W1F6_9ACTN
MTRAPRTLLTALLPALLAALLGVGLLSASATAAPAPTSFTASVTSAREGETATLTWTLRDAAGSEVVGAQVQVERRRGGTWVPLATVTTTGEGPYLLRVLALRDPEENRLRLRWPGDAERGAARSEVSVPLVRRRAAVTLSGPQRLVDERTATLRVRWTADGAPVAGTAVLQGRTGGGAWREAGEVRTDARGRGVIAVRPRVDTRYRVRTPQLPWLAGARSRVLAVDNVPPGRVVRLPAAAPRPRITLPPQARATGEGPNLRITPIPDGVWRSMVGRSWRVGCPVGRAGLRLIRVNYWGYDGYRYRGEVVGATSAAGAMGAALAAMHRQRLPIRAMYRVDRFGFSRRVNGGDDHASMAAGNTSAFNCRWVVNRPGVRSPHSYGRSLDVNPWENPYRSATGLVPNSWWQPRSHPLVAWRSGSHRVVRLMRTHGLAWTYGTGDNHHFDVRQAGRVVRYRGCLRVHCD